MATRSTKTTTTSKAKKARSYEAPKGLGRLALGLLLVGIGISPMADNGIRVFLVAMFLGFIIADYLYEGTTTTPTTAEGQTQQELGSLNHQMNKIIESQELASQALATILQFIHNAQAAGQQRRE